jgi:hypothetical protein
VARATLRGQQQRCHQRREVRGCVLRGRLQRQEEQAQRGGRLLRRLPKPRRQRGQLVEQRRQCLPLVELVQLVELLEGAAACFERATGLDRAGALS